MFDLSSKFNEFYNSCVVLPQTKQNELYEKKRINIERLISGLEEYNAENRTSYSIVETCVQGSVAMSTVVQNQEKNYDIDVAVVFDKESLGELGPLATRNMVANALRKKTQTFKTEPKVKTSCVRVIYDEGYHIDFAVYRRSWDRNHNKYVYEHSGSSWSERELRGITEWFKSKNEDTDGDLRKIVRLSKMFSNSRKTWANMPSGLIQTVVCEETIQTQYNRIDMMFYYSMQEVVRRLEKELAVYAPVDNGRSLTSRKSDIDKMIYWKNRLSSNLENLSILFSDSCTYNDAVQAWFGFFNHDYWSISECNRVSGYNQEVKRYDDTEQFIEDMFPVDLMYRCNVKCEVCGNGWTRQPIDRILPVLRYFLPYNFKIYCEMNYTDCPGQYDIYWKVKNVGPVAERKNMIRGQIQNKGKCIEENTNFSGKHYIECYIVSNGICVAKKRVSIPIRG